MFEGGQRAKGNLDETKGGQESHNERLQPISLTWLVLRLKRSDTSFS
jgi:hypothetical protein